MIEKDPPFFWDVMCDKCKKREERISGGEGLAETVQGGDHAQGH